MRRQLRDEERVPAGLIHLCYNGIDTRVFRPGARRAAGRLARRLAGGRGGLRAAAGKRTGTLLDAFAAVRGLAPGMKLAIVGSGPCLSALQDQARALGILPHCVFEPATSRVADWLHAIDIFVLPSLSEALSNSLMEAMACGCCVAASRVGGNPELVAHGETGMLFEPRDAAGLAGVLRLLMQRLRTARQAGMQCRPPDSYAFFTPGRGAQDGRDLRCAARMTAGRYHSTSGKSPGLKLNPRDARYSVFLNADRPATS